MFVLLVIFHKYFNMLFSLNLVTSSDSLVVKVLILLLLLFSFFKSESFKTEIKYFLKS